MNQTNKQATIKLTILFLGLIAVLLLTGYFLQQKVLPKEVLAMPILTKVYQFLGFASLVLIIATYVLFLKVPAQMPIYFLMLTVFKLGLFISLFLNGDDLNFNIRVAILIPIMVCLILEKLYAFFLFKKLEQEKSTSN